MADVVIDLKTDADGPRKRWDGPQTLTIERGKDGYGFSVRYFVVQPPSSISPTKGFQQNSFWTDQGLVDNEAEGPEESDSAFSDNNNAVMDIFFAKDVQKHSFAEKSGLQQGDRIVSINGDLIGGKSYKDVISLIQSCNGELKLGIIPQEQDILHTIYKDFVSGEKSQQSRVVTRMSTPSVNKWAVKIHPRKTSSVEGKQAPTTEPTGKYDPCVSFVAGTPKLVADGRSSKSSSTYSSGSHTPINKSGSLSPRRSRTNSELENKSTTFDPCVQFQAGRPVRTSDSNSLKSNKSNEDLGIAPQTLNKALRKEVYGKKSYGTRLAPKMIAGVSKPGAVSNMKERFSSDTKPMESPVAGTRKSSATSVLRDDFRDDDARTKSHHASVKLSTNNSQATLVESSNGHWKQQASLVVGTEKTIIIKPKEVKSPSFWRKRNLLGGSRKTSVSSSVENSEDDCDSHVESENESELNNWEDRRASYLLVKEKKKNRTAAEADDEDSDNSSSVPRIIAPKSADDETTPVIKEGPLNRKLERSIDRRKSNARTWKPVYAVLKGHRLFCYKTQGTSDADDDIIQPIPLRSSIIEIASDYVKRRHVIRMVTSHGNEYLFQAEDTASMMSWVNTLRDANPDKESLKKSTASMRKENEQTSPPGSKASSFKEPKKGGLSIKRGHFSLRSKKGRSPTTPIRSPKESMTGKTFGIPIDDCPRAKNVANVPLIVEHCCNVIGERGKEFIGIYRVPGNAGVIQSLQVELDTKDPKDINWDEDKWYELNNIGSLLKSYLRKLPDPLIHQRMYTSLLESNQLVDQTNRLTTIKSVIKSLPESHFATLKFIIEHLRVIADNSSKNKMEPKNLALMFGPNIVRTDELDLAAMVKDMPDQCKIIETLILLSDWIFNPSDEPPPHIEADGDIISKNSARGMMECLNQVNTNGASDSSEVEKKNKLSSFFIRTPSGGKKKTEDQRTDYEDDGDTSGCSSQSPPMRREITVNSQKFKEVHHVIPLPNDTRKKKLASPDASPREMPRGAYDDGCDSGVTSPQRLDSDDNISVTSGSGCSRKESFESLSPSVGRRYNMHISKRTLNNNNSEQFNPAVETTDTSSVKKSPRTKRRGEMRRGRKDGKRDLYSILPGDGNNYEEKIRALLDDDYEGDMKGAAQTEMDGPSRVTLRDRSITPVASNADWWLSGNQNMSKRLFSSPPPDKSAALNIIKNAIDTKKQSPLNASSTPLGARKDEFKYKKEQLDKKVSDILGMLEKTKPGKLKTWPNDLVSSASSSGSSVGSPSQKLDDYLAQVALILNNSEQDINTIKNIKNKVHSNSLRVGSATQVSKPPSNTRTTSVSRSKSTNSPHSRKYMNKRNSPLLDLTYSNLNYSKLYPT